MRKKINSNYFWNIIWRFSLKFHIFILTLIPDNFFNWKIKKIKFNSFLQIDH